MQSQHMSSAAPGRKTLLAVAIVFALGAGAVATAAPADAHEALSAAEHQARQAAAARQAVRAAHRARQSAHAAVASTWTVTNCSGGGVNSLGYIIEHVAGNGDTIDVSACTTIQLTGTLTIAPAIDDLTLVGADGGYLPGTEIIGTGNYRVLHHKGTGTLTLTDIDLSAGYVATSGRGACILSAGDVVLNTTRVHDCIAERAPGSTADAKGGAIYASGMVTMNGLSRVANSKAHATGGDAYGGGIYAGLWVRLKDTSRVIWNTATSDQGNAYGGGIYGESWVDLQDPHTGLHYNKAVTHAGNTIIKGGALYTEMGSLIAGRLQHNDTVAMTSEVYTVGQGVAVYAEDGVELKPYAVIYGNEGWSTKGAGIYTNGYLVMDQATVSGNSGYGIIVAAGDVDIDQSTIVGNRMRFDAAARLGMNATGTLQISRSTISGNVVAGRSDRGAALSLAHDAVIQNSTITGNVERTDSDAKYGAGISLDNGVTVDLSSTIVSGNWLETSSGERKPSDVMAAHNASASNIDVTGDYNLLGLVLPPIQGGNNVDEVYQPKLRPLANNGGLTLTQMPYKVSAAIDAGLANGFAWDQRGPGYPRVDVIYPDIGAVEVNNWNDFIFANGFEW